MMAAKTHWISEFGMSLPSRLYLALLSITYRRKMKQFQIDVVHPQMRFSAVRELVDLRFLQMEQFDHVLA